jgi:sigma-B regulation protein RsbU (phosphoserine phosphatase)
MSVIIVLAYVITRSNAFASIHGGKLNLKNQLLIIIVFGVFSIYGTASGINLMGAIANIRDLGPMIAGLLGGPVTGFGAALIGAAYRYSLGGFTAIPCTVSTIIAGLSSGLIFYLRRGRPTGIVFSLILAASIEIFHMALTAVIAEPHTAAVALVKQVALPMISANSLGMAIFMFIMLNLTKERETEAVKSRIEGELLVAREIQMGIVPKIFPPFPKRGELDIYAFLEPAKEVGGDFYDFFFLNENSLFFTIGDVSGKGVPASLFMAVTKTLLKARAHSELSPEKILAIVNNELVEDNDSGMFVTVFLGILHLPTGRVLCSSAGHNPPVILRKTGTTEKIPRMPGMALGVMEEIAYGSHEFFLREGDAIILYTDGVTEAVDLNGLMFGDNRLEETIGLCAELSAVQITNKIREEIKTFVHEAEQSDDITVLALKCAKISSGFSLCLKNRFEEIQVMSGETENFARLHKIEEKTINHLHLFIEEIFTNIVKYAYDDPAEHKIDFAVNLQDGSITMIFTDDGKEFDPFKSAEVDITSSIEERKIGGLGIYLIKKIADEVKYERADKKNVLTIRMKITHEEDLR